MVEDSEKAERFLKGVGLAELQQDDEKALAVIRALEVIGEAAKRIPQSIRDPYPQIPWSKIIGMRNLVIHEHFGVDLEVAWKTVREDLPPLRGAVAGIPSPSSSGMLHNGKHSSSAQRSGRNPDRRFRLFRLT